MKRLVLAFALACLALAPAAHAEKGKFAKKKQNQAAATAAAKKGTTAPAAQQGNAGAQCSIVDAAGKWTAARATQALRYAQSHPGCIKALQIVSNSSFEKICEGIGLAMHSHHVLHGAAHATEMACITLHLLAETAENTGALTHGGDHGKGAAGKNGSGKKPAGGKTAPGKQKKTVPVKHTKH